MVTIKNIQGTSDPRYQPHPKGYANWLDYYQKMAVEKKGRCRRYRCQNDGIYGCHVQVKDNQKIGDNWYIIPMCAGHNGSNITEAFEVRCGKFVPVNLRDNNVISL